MTFVLSWRINGRVLIQTFGNLANAIDAFNELPEDSQRAITIKKF